MTTNDEEQKTRKQQRHERTNVLITVLGTVSVGILGFFGAHGGVTKTPTAISITFPREPNAPIYKYQPELNQSQPCTNTESATNPSTPSGTPDPLLEPPKPAKPINLDQWQIVPEVKGKTLEQAAKLLENQNFSNIAVIRQGSNGLNIGVGGAMLNMSAVPVDQTEPSAGSRMQLKSPITIYLTPAPPDPNNPKP